MLKRLWLIFGPVLVAAFLVFVAIMLAPVHNDHNYAREREAAVALTRTVFKSGVTKKEALSDKKHRFVPFFGSSEWNRMDAFHPAVMAEAYKRNYRPFLLGQRGAQSLTQFFGMQQILPQLNNKQAIYFISPQWFVKQGEDPNAFKQYYSEGQAIDFLLKAKDTKADRYAAKRLLQMDVSPDINAQVKKVAAGQKLTAADKDRLAVTLAFQTHEDALFADLTYSRNYSARILPKTKELPQPFNTAKLSALATKNAKAHTANNQFGIEDAFYQERIGKHLPQLKGTQAVVDYRQSPEYNDLQLVLDEFAAQNTNVLFVIPPVNSKWIAYTGLSSQMYAESVTKIKAQLTSQGFTNIADFSNRGDEPYFMQDTIHMGWQGWLAFDKAVASFLETPTENQTTYQLDDHYLTKMWANQK